MHRAPSLRPPSVQKQTWSSSTSMSCAPVEPPRSRTSATYSWTSDKTSSPPPYEIIDTYVSATSHTIDPRATVSQKPPSVASRGEAPRSTGYRRTNSSLSIPHLREALNSLESKMASLLNERDMLESRLEQAVRLQSPVQRLPNELLASIFVIGVLGMGDEDSLMLSTLMLVCRYWKEVAVNTPVLWSRVVAGTRHSLDKAGLKLERSKSAPLHICVDFDPKVEHGSVTTESIVHTMDLLRTSIWRWKTFRLTVPNRPQAHAALMRCKEEAPMLEVLSICILRSMQEDHYSNPPLPLFAGRTPNLRSCSFTSFHFAWDMNLVTGLRVLKLGGYWNGFSPSVDTILGILRACPQLEEFVLRNMSDVDSNLDSCANSGAYRPNLDESSERPVRVSDSRMISLPRLTKASFYYSGTVRTRTVLSLLSLPALEKIELCYLDNVAPMIEHLQRQSLTCLPLRHLRIESSFFNELKLVRLLSRLPSLTTLDLVDAEDASSYLLKSLSTPPGTQSWVCPKLTDVTTEGCTNLDWDALRTFVESRLPAQSRAFPRQLGPSSSASRSFAPSPAPSVFVPSTTSTSSASAFAANAHILRAPITTHAKSGMTSPGSPHRLKSIDLTRCHQISKEMVQWLRMYVAEVKCDGAKGVWGEPSML